MITLMFPGVIGAGRTLANPVPNLLALISNLITFGRSTDVMGKSHLLIRRRTEDLCP